MNNVSEPVSNKNRYIRPWAILGMDTAISFISSLLAILLIRWLTEPIFNFDHFVFVWICLAVAGSLIGFFTIGSSNVVLKHSTPHDIAKLGIAVFIKELLLLLCIVFNVLSIKTMCGGFLLIILDFLLSLVSLTMWRIIIISLLNSAEQSIEVDAFRMNVLVYGSTNKSVSIVSRMAFSPHYNIVGFIDNNRELDGKMLAGKKVRYANSLEDFDKVCCSLGGVQFVLFAKKEDKKSENDRLVKWCTESGIHLLMVPEVEEVPIVPFSPYQHALNQQITPSNIFENFSVQELKKNAGFILDGMNEFERVVKRCLDCILSAGLIVVFSPLMFVCYIAIKKEDKGPVLYRQERIGRFGRPFEILKFRSMRTDAETSGPALYAGDDDPRLTSTGRFLRVHHLDELPQLFNVFKGDMAFVGYRPERQFYIEQIMKEDPRYCYLYQIRPGVTSYATLHNGYADSIEKMVRRLQFDLHYLRNRSLWFDAKVLWQTFANIAFGKKF